MSKFNSCLKFIKKGDTQKLVELLHDSAININQIDGKSGNGLIHIAIENSDLQIFNILAKYPNINLQLTTKDGQHPLEMAVRLNDITFVNRLLELNVNTRKKNKQGQTVFHTAIRNQTDKEIIKKLLNNKFYINQKIDYYGSFLNLAIVAGQTDNFFYLIKQIGIKYQTTNQEDDTSLILAVKYNRGDFVVAILEKLQSDTLLTPIQKQFFINAQNKDGNTAIHEACLKDLQTITKKLEQFGERLGIDLSIKNKKGQTIELIRISQQKSRINEIEMQNKRHEQKIVRKKQKQESKIRQRQQEQLRLIEQKRRLKEQQKRLQLQTKIQSETTKQKTIWITAILIIIVLAGMYLFLTNAIQKKKNVTL